jgi:replicative DNA helicase
MATDEQVERTALPTAEGSAESVLASMMVNNASGLTAMAILKEDDFFLERHRKLYRFFCTMIEKGKSFDQITVIDALMRRKKLAEVGGVEAVAGLTDNYPVHKIETYCHQVLAASRQRQLINLANSTLSKAWEQGCEVDEIIGDVQNTMIAMTMRGEKSATMEEVAQQVMADIMAKRDGSKKARGISTTFDDLDTATNGINPGDYVIIAGRTGQGKSSFARQIALQAAQDGEEVVYVTYEMTKENLMQCLISTESGVAFDLIRDPRFMTIQQLDEVAQSAARIRALPLEIDDCSGRDISELCARLRAHRMRGKKLAIVDQLQMIPDRSADSEYMKVTHCSAMLRDLAKQTLMPVVALSQLKRPPEESENSEPTIYGLKQSGDIENDAFTVWLIYRPKEKDPIDGKKRFTGMDKIIIGKNRNGPLDTVLCGFVGPQLKFVTRTAQPEPENLPVTPQPTTPAAQHYLDGLDIQEQHHDD